MKRIRWSQTTVSRRRGLFARGVLRAVDRELLADRNGASNADWSDVAAGLSLDRLECRVRESRERAYPSPLWTRRMVNRTAAIVREVESLANAETARWVRRQMANGLRKPVHPSEYLRNLEEALRAWRQQKGKRTVRTFTRILKIGATTYSGSLPSCSASTPFLSGSRANGLRHGSTPSALRANPSLGWNWSVPHSPRNERRGSPSPSSPRNGSPFEEARIGSERNRVVPRAGSASPTRKPFARVRRPSRRFSLAGKAAACPDYNPEHDYSVDVQNVHRKSTTRVQFFRSCIQLAATSLLDAPQEGKREEGLNTCLLIFA